MIHKKNRIYGLLLLTLLITACSEEDESYFPLTKGYKWQYDVQQTTRDGLDKQKYILENLGKVTIDGDQVYLRRAIDGTLFYYQEDEDNLNYLGYRDTKKIDQKFVSEKQIVLPVPIKLDAVWEQNTTTKLLKKTGPPQKTVFRIEANVDLDATITSLNESVRVPAGVFNNCLKITMYGSSFKDAGNYVGMTLVSVKQTSWYAKGVGMVKMERLETTESDALDKGSLLIELVKFSQ